MIHPAVMAGRAIATAIARVVPAIPSLLAIRHCEERSDEAIQANTAVLDCFAFGSQ
jgi:hypothetical protein